MLTFFTYLFGVIFILLGVLGFIPQLTPEDRLLEFFQVNFFHNMVYLITGILAFTAGHYHYSRAFIQVLGIIYGLGAVLGFEYGNNPLFGKIANNLPDAILHAIIAVFALYLGFFFKKEPKWVMRN